MAGGGVGSLAVQLASKAGATVVAPALPEDEDYLRNLGVSGVVPRDGDVVAAVRERYPDGVDALLDFVNYAPGTYDAALKDGARVASPTGAAGEGPGRTMVMATPSAENLLRLGALLADGTLRLAVQASYPLPQARRRWRRTRPSTRGASLRSRSADVLITGANGKQFVTLTTIRVITWNVARRVSALAAQAAAAAERAPDVLALQEVTARTLPLWRAALATIGLGHVACTLDAADPRRVPAGPRRTGVLLAAREPLTAAAALPVPWPETALAARLGAVELHTVHVPNAANGEIKPRTLAALRAGLIDRPEPALLCGDLNTPRREAPDGTVWSFARDGRGRLRAERAGFWDESELGVVPGLAQLGWADAYRSLHGYGAREPSWTWRRISGHGGGWRLDHIFCSPGLVPVACTYHHGWRDAGLSDHSALEAEVAPRSSPGNSGR